MAFQQYSYSLQSLSIETLLSWGINDVAFVKWGYTKPISSSVLVIGIIVKFGKLL